MINHLQSQEPIVLLASKSPRRRELLDQLGIVYETVDVSVPELPLTGEQARAYAERVARAKARAGAASRNDLPVLGADTAVAVEGEIFGKPTDAEDARRMLIALSGRSHQVFSSVALAHDGKVDCVTQVSTVRFCSLDDRSIEAYWASGEPQDKAGAYAIQGLGAAFVEELKGSYTGVMGLPLFETLALMRDAGVGGHTLWQQIRRAGRLSGESS